MELLAILEDWQQSQNEHLEFLETTKERLEQEIGNAMGEVGNPTYDDYKDIHGK